MYERNVAQSGDALTLLGSLTDCCTLLVFFDTQYRGVLDKLKYGNESTAEAALQSAHDDQWLYRRVLS